MKDARDSGRGRLGGRGRIGHGLTKARRLAERIGAEARMGFSDGAGTALDPRVLEAIARVPREAFVPRTEAMLAYIDGPLPIGHGQTISKPTVVAYMTSLLALEPDHVALEIGTGSGYQAAVLAELARAVFSVEVIPALAETATERLRDLGYDNVTVRCGDGHEGWPEHAPYDAIIVTAATPEIPPSLIHQLREGARLVIPLGRIGEVQEVTLLEKGNDGRISQRRLLPVRFVPLTNGPRPAPGRG